jgi:hypothetical protein
MTTKWYVGKFNNGRIFAVYKATYNDKILTSEKAWSLPNGKSWENTNQVSQWYFIGNDTVWEATEKEAKSYLPATA